MLVIVGLISLPSESSMSPRCSWLPPIQPTIQGRALTVEQWAESRGPWIGGFQLNDLQWTWGLNRGWKQRKALVYPRLITCFSTPPGTWLSFTWSTFLSGGGWLQHFAQQNSLPSPSPLSMLPVPPSPSLLFSGHPSALLVSDWTSQALQVICFLSCRCLWHRDRQTLNAAGGMFIQRQTTEKETEAWIIQQSLIQAATKLKTATREEFLKHRSDSERRADGDERSAEGLIHPGWTADYAFLCQGSM